MPIYDENGSMNINLQDYENRTDTRKRYGKHLIRTGQIIQSAEINEIQDTAHLRLKTVGDALWNDGTVIAGMEAGFDAEGGVVSCGSGTIYINGEVHAVDPATLHILTTEPVTVGVWYYERIITEIQDGDLRNPANGTAGFQRPGAARLQINTEWGLASDSAYGTDASAKFYALYTVSDGKIMSGGRRASDTSDTYLDQCSEMIRRYDRESNGHFVIEGLEVTALESKTPGKHVYSISAGKARVNGWEVVKPYAERFVVDERQKVLEVESEEHIYDSAGGEAERIDLYHAPVDVISSVRVLKERTETIERGSYAGGSDRLNGESILKIVKVEQSGVVYAPETDYRFLNDSIVWRGNQEPAPGSQYNVTFQYRELVQPMEPDADGFTVSGAVEGSTVIVRYSYRLPRYDILTLDSDGNFDIVYGVSHRSFPVAPRGANEKLRLATIHQTWDGLPEVENDGIRVTSMKQLNSYSNQIVDLYDLVSQERLKTNAMLMAPSTSRGVFVDNFNNNNMRDAGQEQDALTGNEYLMLPMAVKAFELGNKSNTTLPFAEETILAQLARTGSMKINPYQAADPLPAHISVDPEIDRWAETKNVTLPTVYNNPIISYQTVSGSRSGTSTSTSYSSSVKTSTTTGDAEYLRARKVNVKGGGFGHGVTVYGEFGGVPVELTSQTSDPEGNISTSFTTPVDMRVGTYQVRIYDTSGQSGTAAFTGEGTLTINASQTTVTERRVVTTYVVRSSDPLAQTFMLNEPRYVTSIDLWFEKRGVSDVCVQIRDTLTGLPNRTVYAEGRIHRDDIRQGQANTITFDRPVLLDADTEYAIVVLTDTSDHELAIAELGQWDKTYSRWLTSQAYEVGVLLSSANASTWTPHQTMDLWFRLKAARFTETTCTVRLGDITLDDATDILALADVEYPDSRCDVTFIVKPVSDGEELVRLQPNQSIELDEKVSGGYAVFAELNGTEKLSPVIYSGTQFMQGTLGTTGTYISRSFPCGEGKKIIITLDLLAQGSAKFDVFVQGDERHDSAPTVWTPAEQKKAAEIGYGWRETTFEAACDLLSPCIKIALSGTPKDRPRAMKLRAVVVDA